MNSRMLRTYPLLYLRVVDVLEGVLPAGGDLDRLLDGHVSLAEARVKLVILEAPPP
jgi:hypothetical protein